MTTSVPNSALQNAVAKRIFFTGVILRSKLLKGILGAFFAFSMILINGIANAQTTVTYSYTGANQTFTVPAGINTLTISMWGAGGGGVNTGGSGGSGALMQGSLSVSGGQVLTLVVGGAGSASAASTAYGGGGASGAAGTGGGGGGYTGIFSSTTLTQANALVIAGAGGGGGYYGNQTYGGGGGATAGSAAGNLTAKYTGGLGATTSIGGTGGLYNNSQRGTSGSALTGGPGGMYTYGGGGGGGGYYGGGGGYGGTSTNFYSSGGGGGSSYASGTFTISTNTAGNIDNSQGGGTIQAPGSGVSGYVTGVGNGGNTTGPTNGGNGLIIITYTLSAPVLTAASGATVDGPFTVTFTDNAAWRGAITSITVGGTTLPTSAYTISAGQIVFTPSASALLQTAGSLSISVLATGYSADLVTQPLAAGAAKKLAIKTQPVAPATNGAVLATQPAVYIEDQYGNITTSNATVTATVGSGAWTIGGTAGIAGSAGTATFTNLTATSSSSVSATITFTSGTLTSVTSNAFTIPAPPPPTLTAASGATVDNPFIVTFTDNPTWRGLITGITVNGTTLATGAYSVTAGQITFTPSASTLLQTAGTVTIGVSAGGGFTTTTVSQAIGAGAPTKLIIKTQPAAPATNGAVLGTQPAVYIEDQYGNVTTSTASITATATGGTWTIGGGANPLAATSGTATFSGLTATSAAAVPAATITFSSGTLTSVVSNSFAIPGPPQAYYSKSTGNLDVLGTWGTNTDGSGTAPTNFTAAGQTFNIVNNPTPTIGSAWTVSGGTGATLSVVNLGNGSSAINFTIPSGFAFAGTINILANGTLTNQNTTNPTFGTLNATSTVNYNGTGAQTVAVANYGNLIISGTRTGTPAITLASGTINVATAFSVTESGAVTYTNTGNTVNFASALAMTIPAINYLNITNTGNGPRTLASTGTIVIAGTVFTPGTGLYTITGSTVQLSSATGFALTLPSVSSGNSFNILSITGAGSFSLPASSSTQNLANTLNISAGTFILNPSSNSSTVNTISVGTINITGGTMDDQSQVSSGITSILQINTAWNQTAGTVTNTGSGVDKLQFTGGGNTTYSGLTAAGSFQYFGVQISNNTVLALSTALTINGLSGPILTIDAGSTYTAGTFLTTDASTGGSFLISGKFQTADLAGFSGSTTTSLVSTNSPTVTLNSGSTVEYNAASGTQTVTARTDYSNLTFSNASAKTVAGVTSVAAVLTLNGGIATTTTSNTLSVTNTATTAVVGGSTTSFINGPLNWSLLPNLTKTSNTTYNFPVGAGTTYLPFSVDSLTTGATGPTLQIAAFGTSAGGTADGTTLTAVSSTEYWSSNLVSGTVTNASVSLTRQTTLSPYNAIGKSSTKTGSYSSLAGTVSGTSILNSNNVISGSQPYYYLFGTLAVPSLTISDNGTQVGAQSLTINTTNDTISIAKIVSALASSTTLNSVSFVTSSSSTYTTSDIGSAGFKLWYSTTNKFSSATPIGSGVSSATGPGETLTFSSLGLSLPNGTYYFWLTANISSGATAGHTIIINGLTSSSATATGATVSGSTSATGTETIVAACTTPTTPSSIGSVSSTSTTISGTVGGTTSTGYVVLFSTSSINPSLANGTTYTSGSAYNATTTVGYVGTSPNFTSTTLTSNTNYYIYAFAYNNTNCGGGPLYSGYIQSSIYTCLVSPTGLNATSVQSTTATVNWTAPAGTITSYTLDVSQTAGSFGAGNDIAGFPVSVASGTSYNITGLNVNTTYYYQVTANNTSNNSTCGTSSPASAPGNFTTVDATLATDYFQSKATGNWSNPTTWLSSHNGVTFIQATAAPTSSAKSVFITNTNTSSSGNYTAVVVTVDVPSSSGPLDIQATTGTTASSNTTNLIMNANLYVNGYVEIDGPTAYSAGTPNIDSLSVGNNTLTITGNLVFDGTYAVGTEYRQARLSIGGASGVVNVAGSVNETKNSGADQIYFTGAGTNGKLNVKGDWNFASSVLSVSATSVISGNGTVSFSGNTVQNINVFSTTSFPNLSDSNTTANLLVHGNINIVNTLKMIGANTHLIPDSAVIINSGGAAGTISGNGIIEATSNALPSGSGLSASLVGQYKFSTYSLSAMTVDYTANGNQTVNAAAAPYGNLIINGGTTSQLDFGSGIKTLDGSLGTGTVNGVNGYVQISAGSFSASSSNYNVTLGGNWIDNTASTTGSFTPGAGTVYFNGGAAQAITGTSTGQTFNNINTVASNTALSIAGSTTTLRLNNAMTIGSGTTVAAGTASSIYVAGNWTDNTGSSAGGFTPGTGAYTVFFNGKTAQSIGGTATGQTFNNVSTLYPGSGTTALSVAGSTATLNLNGAMTIGATTTLSSGTATSINMLAGNWIDNTSGATGGFSAGTTNTVYFKGSTAQTISGSATGQTFNNITTAGTTALSVASSTATLNLNGTMTIGSGTTVAAGTASSIYVAGNWTDNTGSSAGGFTPGTGAYTVFFNGKTAQSIGGTATGQTFNNVSTLYPGSGTTALSVAGSTATLNLNGAMTIGATTTLSSGTATSINMLAGNWIDNTSGATGGFSAGTTNTVYFKGSTAQTISGSATGQTFNNITTAGTTALSVASSTATLNLNGTMTIGSGTTVAAGTASSIYVAGNWTDNTGSSAGGFTPGTGAYTVFFNGKTAQSIGGTATGQTFNNVSTLYPGSGTTALSVAGSTATLNLNGAMTIGATTTLSSGTATSINMLAGNWIDNTSGATGGFSAGTTNTVYFKGSTAQTITGGGSNTGQTFNNITVQNTGSGLVAVNGTTATLNLNSLLLSSGSLASGTATNINVAGNWTNNISSSGFTAGSGKVTFNGSSTLGSPTQLINGGQSTNFNTLNIQSVTSTTLGVSIGLTGNLTVSTSTTASTFDIVNYSVTGTSAGTLTVQGTGTLRLSGTTGVITGSNFPSGFNRNAFTQFSTTEYYDGTGTGQTIAVLASPQSFTYGNLTLTNNSVKTAPSGLTISNNMLINTGATFAAGSYTHNVGANWTNNGAFNASNGIINFNGTSTGNIISGSLTGANAFNYLTFNGSGAWSFSNSADVAADFTLTNGSVTAPSGLLNVAGNWINNGGSFSGGSGTVSLNGGVAQAIKGSQSTAFNKLDINNSAGLADVLQIATTAATISFTNSGGNGSGYIDATNFPLTLTTPAAITTASPTGYVIVTGAANSGLIVQGIPQTTGFQFPIGVVSSGNHYYLPATVAPETAPNNGLTWTAKVYTPVTTNGVYNSGLNYSGVALEGIINVAWDITPTGYQNINVDKTMLTVNWVYNSAIENPLFLGYGNNIGISHFTSGAWQGATTTGSANNGSDAVNSTNYATSEFTSFSPFAVGPKDDPLPVILVDFNAVLNNNKTVGLTWTTQQELNTSHFEVERSADGINWTSIGTVAAAGNSSLPTHYEFTDASPLSSNFYRIKMVNINNDFGYTTERFIKLLQVKEILVFPNPARNYVNVSVSKAEVDLNVKLINQIGQVMQVSQIKAGSGAVLTFDLHNYAQGTYFVQVSGSDGTMQTNKIIIMR